MWLWWLAAKMTGPSQIARGARALRRASTRTAAPSGRIHVGRLDAPDRARRPRPVPRREVHRLGRRRVARRGACSTSVRSCPRSRAPANAPSSMRVSNASSSATISSTRSSELSPSSSSVVAGDRSSRPAYFATSAASASRAGLHEPRRAAALHPLADRRRVSACACPSVRGSSGSGQTSARRIL